MRNLRSVIKYYVYDESTGSCSEFYDSRELAQHDLDNDITCIWGIDSKIIECCIDSVDNDVLWER